MNATDSIEHRVQRIALVHSGLWSPFSPKIESTYRPATPNYFTPGNISRRKPPAFRILWPTRARSGSVMEDLCDGRHPRRMRHEEVGLAQDHWRRVTRPSVRSNNAVRLAAYRQVR